MRRRQPRFTLPKWIGMVAILLGVSQPSSAQEAYFPDLVFLPKDKEVNTIIVDMTEVHLKAMKEPSLWKLSRQDRTTTAYRFLWLASGRHPICLRLTPTDGAFTLHVGGHDGPPGITAGRQNLDKTVKLSARQVEKIIARIQNSKFWTAPVSVKETLGIADGDVIVIEGMKEGKYHVIRRAGSASGESYKQFCRALLELADEPEVLKAWDDFRKGEKDSPDYLPEPPQTEYLGEDHFR